ncbi:hypothetical protein AK88_03992 [Plasmodium fragile]|uniref:Uncharacterized protein n=1 Tax=Plasmodium fragile TaxID=5857 RepID=A0A0D9QH65_PLAFR|nr:uncharacterized protein AK88_03992 [Plasmodium fragile]KJP86359.1 hypothetical protein AK88_03992 [Plasmodium fragile]
MDAHLYCISVAKVSKGLVLEREGGNIKFYNVEYHYKMMKKMNSIGDIKVNEIFCVIFSNDLEYIQSKNIAEILEGLLGYVYFEKPQNVVESLIGQLKKLERKHNEKKVFDAEDIKAVYNFLNLQNEKCISREKCILGLSQFVLNNKQREFMESAKIGSDVDLEVFTSYALENKK